MLDDLHSEGLSEAPRRKPDAKRPLSDREVPLGPPGTALADTLHAWLDGEATESSARRGDSAREVDFWKRLDDDLVRRRRLRTPAGLEARIMAALPMHAPRLITPWWRREMVVSPSGALAAVVTMMAVAAAATALLLR
jgi:hypothetical protein